jgi:glucokinase
LIFKKAYQNQAFASFADIVTAFLKEANVSTAPVAACFAVAGPVAHNRVCFTNINWTLDGELLSKDLGIKSVLLVNDFVAQGYGLLTLDEENECHVIQQAPKQLNAPIACIGAGTGLGECYLTPVDDKGAYRCFASEGGHAEFAPRNEVFLLTNLLYLAV